MTICKLLSFDREFLSAFFSKPGHIYSLTIASICEQRNLFPSDAETAVCDFRCFGEAEREDGCRVCDPAGFVVEL